MEFNSQKAIKTLRKNIEELSSLATQLEFLRNQFSLAKAALMDAQQAARSKAFEDDIPVSKIREYIKYKTHKEEKLYEKLRIDLKQLDEKKEILIEGNNSLKFAYRLSFEEMKNLPYQP